VASAVLGHLGVTAAPLDVGHVAPARWILDAVDDTARAALTQALGKKDRAQVARAAAAAGGDVAALAAALVGLAGPAEAVLTRARAMPWPQTVLDALDELAAALAGAARLAPGARFTVDLGELRGFDYYTGLRFAGYAHGAGDAVLRGGRYDELVGRYGRAARAVGFAIDIEAVAQAQRAAALEAPPPSPGALVVADDRAVAAAIATALRTAGVRAAIDLGHVPGRGPATARLPYAAETGWTDLVDADAAVAHHVAGGSAPIPRPAISAAADGDGAALAAIIITGRS